MVRYLAISTLVVVAVATIVGAYMERDLIRIKIASTFVPARAKPAAPNPPPSRNRQPFRGVAPWALSALPECLRQTSESTGPSAYVLGHLPAQAVPVASPATLRYGNCTIFIRDGEAWVRRGSDLLYIPPPVRFWRTPRSLVMLRESRGGNDLRVYEPAQR
jgi:hypothetical protein